jgi:hypothetical protein
MKKRSTVSHNSDSPRSSGSSTADDPGKRSALTTDRLLPLLEVLWTDGITQRYVLHESKPDGRPAGSILSHDLKNPSNEASFLSALCSLLGRDMSCVRLTIVNLKLVWLPGEPQEAPSG